MPDFPASLVEFQRQFSDDDACAAWLIAARWPSGFRCPACAGAKGWPHGGKPFTFECAACGKQTLGDGRHNHARFEAAFDRMVLGRLSHGHPFEWNVRTSEHSGCNGLSHLEQD